MHDAHMSALETKHASLDTMIEQESQRPQPDDVALAKLKKEKLRVKEALHGL